MGLTHKEGNVAFGFHIKMTEYSVERIVFFPRAAFPWFQVAWNYKVVMGPGQFFVARVGSAIYGLG